MKYDAITEGLLMSLRNPSAQIARKQTHSFLLIDLHTYKYYNYA